MKSVLQLHCMQLSSIFTLKNPIVNSQPLASKGGLQSSSLKVSQISFMENIDAVDKQIKTSVQIKASLQNRVSISEIHRADADVCPASK